MFTKEQLKEFEELAKPLIKWLNENGDPHSQAVIEPDSAAIYGGEAAFFTDEFIKD